MAVGTTEMAILIGIAVLFFGAKKIPELARSLGLAKGEYEMAVSEVRNCLLYTSPSPRDRG